MPNFQKEYKPPTCQAVEYIFFHFDGFVGQYYDMPGDQHLDDQSQPPQPYQENTVVEETSLEPLSLWDTTLARQTSQFSDAQEYSTANWNTNGQIALGDDDWQPTIQIVNPVNILRQVSIWDSSDAVINSGFSNAIEKIIQPRQTPLVSSSLPLFVTDAVRPSITTNTFDTNPSIEPYSSAASYDTSYEPIKVERITSPQDIRGTKRRRNEGNVLPGRMCFMISSNAPGPTIQERAPTSESARKKRHVVRNLGACLRCRWMKRTLSSHS
jgi:hypothetical protein